MLCLFIRTPPTPPHQAYEVRGTYFIIIIIIIISIISISISIIIPLRFLPHRDPLERREIRSLQQGHLAARFQLQAVG